VNVKKMMKQAQEMQARMMRELEALELEGSAGGGAVKVKLSGTKKLVDVQIDPSVMADGDADMLRDLILAAWGEASDQLDRELEGRLGGLPGLGM